jgi:hypothetical protein
MPSILPPPLPPSQPPTALRDASSRMNRESTKRTKTRKPGGLGRSGCGEGGGVEIGRSLNAQLAIATKNLAVTKRSHIDSNRLFLSELKYVFVDFDAHRLFAGVLLLISTLSFRSKVSIGFL